MMVQVMMVMMMMMMLVMLMMVQDEELEVMKSIYEGDELYSSPKDNRHLYKFGEDTASRSFILGEKKNQIKMVKSDLGICFIIDKFINFFRDKLGS